MLRRLAPCVCSNSSLSYRIPRPNHLEVGGVEGWGRRPLQAEVALGGARLMPGVGIAREPRVALGAHVSKGRGRHPPRRRVYGARWRLVEVRGRFRSLVRRLVVLGCAWWR